MIKRSTGPEYLLLNFFLLLSYCCIGDLNGRGELRPIVWNEGSNWRLRLTNGQMKFEKYFINDLTIIHVGMT